jgi:hypothetical protein
MAFTPWIKLTGMFTFVDTGKDGVYALTAPTGEHPHQARLIYREKGQEQRRQLAGCRVTFANLRPGGGVALPDSVAHLSHSRRSVRRDYLGAGLHPTLLARIELPPWAEVEATQAARWDYAGSTMMLTNEITLVYPDVDAERLEIRLVTATGTEPIIADPTSKELPLQLQFVPEKEDKNIGKGQCAPHFRHHFALCTSGLDLVPKFDSPPDRWDPGVGILFTCLNAQAAPESA